jgi:hypothetical protein
VQTTAYRFSTTASFSDRSPLGPVPLLIPVVIAGVGVWGAWRGRWLPLAIATAIMLVLTRRAREQRLRLLRVHSK